MSSTQVRSQEVEGDFVGTANQSEQLGKNLSHQRYAHWRESLPDEGAMENEKVCLVRAHLWLLIAKMTRLEYVTSRLLQHVQALQGAQAMIDRWTVSLKAHLVVSRLTQRSVSGRCENRT